MTSRSTPLHGFLYLLLQFIGSAWLFEESGNAFPRKPAGGVVFVISAHENDRRAARQHRAEQRFRISPYSTSTREPLLCRRSRRVSFIRKSGEEQELLSECCEAISKEGKMSRLEITL